MNRLIRVAKILVAEQLIVKSDEGALHKIALEQVKNRIEPPTRDKIANTAKDILSSFGEIANRNNIETSGLDIVEENYDGSRISFKKITNNKWKTWAWVLDAYPWDKDGAYTSGDDVLNPIGVSFELFDETKSSARGGVISYFLPWSDDIDVKRAAQDLWNYVHLKVANGSRTASSTGQVLSQNKINMNEIFKQQLKNRIELPGKEKMLNFLKETFKKLDDLMSKDGYKTIFLEGTQHLNFKESHDPHEYKALDCTFVSKLIDYPIGFYFAVNDFSYGKKIELKVFVPWEDDIDSGVIARLLFQAIRYQRMNK